jgi:TetR/AcrR family transcriptional regulator, tetracycline repressor protein
VTVVAAPASGAPPHPKRRGRPPRWSREQIVDAVAEMLLADPTAPLTIARAAEAVGAKPMSLYRHFRDRDDLVAAVARRVLFEAPPTLDTDASWQEQVRAWMLSLHEQARRVPQLVQMMASGESAEWVVASAYLATIFDACGIDDDRLVADAIYWVATVTMGHVMIEAAGAGRLHDDRIRASLDRLEEDDAVRVGRLVPHFADLGRDGFASVTEWVIRQLEWMLARGDSGSVVGT